MAETYHLKNFGTVWYYYRRVPKAYVDLIGKSFIKESLATPFLRKAKQRRAAKAAQYEQLFKKYDTQLAEKSEPPILTQTHAESLVQNFVSRTNKEWTKRFHDDPPTSQAELKEMIIETTNDWANLGDPEHLAGYGIDSRTFDEITEGIGYAFSRSDFSFNEFFDLVVRGLRECHRRHLALLKNDHSNTYIDSLFENNLVPAQTATLGTADVSFGWLCDAYFTEYKEEASPKGIAPKRIEKVKASVELLKEAIGEKVPISQLNYQACQSFRKRIAELPANRNKIYPKLGFDDAIAKGKEDGKASIGYETQSLHLATLTSVLELGVRLGKMTTVPSKNMRPLAPKEKAADKRRPFTAHELQAIFSAPIYTGCVDDGMNFAKPGPNVIRRARFWVPLICLFTGMRANEVCQLKLSDIKSDKSMHFFKVDDDTSDKTIKNASSRRTFPVHPELVRIGFLDYVSETLHAGKKDVFPELKPGKYGYKSQRLADWFTSSFLPKVVEKDGKITMHSLRHNFRDALRDIEAPSTVLQQLGGWSTSNGVSDNYGAGHKPEHLMKYVEKIAYPGLDLSHLYVSD